MTFVRALLGLLLTAAWGPARLGAQAAPLPLSRVTGPITIDGNLDDPAWRAIAPLPLTTYAPVFRAQPTQRTEIRVGYDDDYFYAAGWFYDTDPSGIRINSLYRDRWNGDDAFAIYLDPFNDNQNSKWFGTTPGGIRFDQLVSDDGATLNESWDTFWTSKTVVTDEGWFAEVRIPLSSIGFRASDDGTVVMGLTVTRLVSRLGERVTFPEIDPKFEFRRPSLARDVMLSGLRTRTPLYVTPYVLGGATRKAVAVSPGFRFDDATEREAGLDIRYPISSQLTLDLTANTDFAQVEADDQQVNLDRFPLFYPERRRLFQEGSGIFDFSGAGGTRLFNSRRIGLAADFTPVRILGGGRLVGRIGQWDVGMLAMQTQAQNQQPGEHFDVVRFRRPVFNPYSTAGVMVTSYFGGDRRNVGLGADGSFRVRGDNYLTLKWAASADNEEVGSISLIDRSQFDLRWERRTGRGLQYNATLARSGNAYRPELAFQPRRDFTTANFAANYFIFTDRHSFFRRVYPGAIAFNTFRNGDGALESAQYAVWVQWDTKAGGGGWIEPKVFHENVATPFRLGGTADIPAGKYTFADLQLVLTMPTGARLRTSIDARAGSYFDGTRAQILVYPTWNVSRHLELGGEYQASLLRFPTRNQKANIHVARLRVRVAGDARTSGNAFVQYNSTTDRLDLNVRLRYAFAEGTDLWLVYNEGLDTERSLDPAGLMSPRSLARALLVKLTYTLGSR
ncbi:MAG: DUF5916 domain-containing protein [Gemmatimonadales bacterium]|nr:DUF5916 domain-containing protein [Gemmatimonadales bacterium]